MGQRIALNAVTTTPQEGAQLCLLLRDSDIEGEVIVPSGEITLQIGFMAFPGLLPMEPQIVDVERWIVERRTHPVQITIGVTALDAKRVIQTGLNPGIHVPLVVNKGRAWILKVELRKQSVGVELAADLKIGIAGEAIQTLKQRA